MTRLLGALVRAVLHALPLLLLGGCLRDQQDEETHAANNPVNLAVSVTGSGHIASDPAGIDCGTDCAQDYDSGSRITLTATPEAGFRFSGWSGACTGHGACVVTVTTNQTVIATFTATSPQSDPQPQPQPQPVQHSLSISVTGNGSANSSPAGINCGADCTENYDSGTNVTLTAVPGANQNFIGWIGCPGTNPTCSITMDAAHSVTATFAPVQHSLAVSVSGTGTVTSNPTGIACGNDCTQDYDHGTNVMLTAIPGANFQFASWGGAGTGNVERSVTMDANQSVTAAFVAISSAPTVTLSVNPVTVTAGGASVLTWSSINTTSCSASGTPTWSGTKATSGNETVSAINATSTFILTCTDPNGSSAEQRVTVFVQSDVITLYEQDFEDWNIYSPDLHLTEGARAEHSTGWNGGGAAKMYLGTPPGYAHYSGWQNYSVPESLYQTDRAHVRWCVQFGPALLQSTLDGGKLLIFHRNTPNDPNRVPNPRIMANWGPYSSTPPGWQIFSANNVDNAPPNPPLFTLEDKIGQWMCFEVGVSQQNNTRQFWATVQGGPEVLLQTEPLNRTDGIWTGGVEFGYWGPVSNVSPDSWWKLDELVISNAKIGPPPGFASQ